MAIQLRKGADADFDKSKMLQGECAITTDGKFYYCYTAGQVKELMSKEELVGILNTSGENYDRLMELLESEESWEEFVDAYVEELTDAYTDDVLTPATTEINATISAFNTTVTEAEQSIDTAVENAESTIASLIGSVYRFAGSSLFANLPTLSASDSGDVYNILDDFVTDSTFVDGSGNSYSAGTNIAVVVLDGSPYWDVLSSTVDLSSVSNPTFEEATALSNINSGESQSTIFGKIKKWYTDLISKIGTETLTTTAQDLSGAVNENKTNIDTLNSNLENQFKVFTETTGGMSVSAGTIGTRGAQKEFLLSEIESAVGSLDGYALESMMITFTTNSSAGHPIIFSDNNNIYINVYRCVSNAFTHTCFIRVVYRKNL